MSKKEEMTMRCVFFTSSIEQYPTQYGEQLTKIREMKGKVTRKIETLNVDWIDQNKVSIPGMIIPGGVDKIPIPQVYCAIYFDIPISIAEGLDNQFRVIEDKKIQVVK